MRLMKTQNNNCDLPGTSISKKRFLFITPEIVQHPFFATVLTGGGIFPALRHTGPFSSTDEHFPTGKKGQGLWRAQGTCRRGEG